MESLKNVLKSLGSPSMVPYVTPRNESAVGRPKTYSIIIHKMGFYDFFFFPDSNCISDIPLPK